jgi:hypothetical protein
VSRELLLDTGAFVALTLDRRGFSAYRWLKTRTFTILP